MKRVYSTPGDEYISERDAAADAWVLSHRPQYDAMAREAFPDGWRPGAKGTTRQRMDFLNDQAALRAGFPTFAEWMRQHGHTTDTESAA